MTAAAAPRVRVVDVRSLAFWGMIAMSALGLWTLQQNSLPAVLVFPPSSALNIAVLLSCLAVGVWLARRFLRPVQAPPWAGTWLALMWGGLAASGMAILMNSRLLSVWSQALGLETSGVWAAALTAPLNEEVAKAAGVVMLAAVSTRLVRSAADGLILGALIGLGFQIVENFTYGFTGIMRAGGVEPFTATFQTLWVRIVLTGVGSHWAMTAVAGAGVGYLVSASGRSTARRVRVALGCLVVAMAMHFLFDSPLLGGTTGTLAKPIVNFVVVIAVYLVVRYGFRTRWAAVTAEETAAGSLTADEARSLSRRGSRHRHLRRFRAGPEREAQARLQRLQLALLEERIPERLPAEAAQPWRDAIAAARPVV